VYELQWFKGILFVPLHDLSKRVIVGKRGNSEINCVADADVLTGMEQAALHQLSETAVLLHTTRKFFISVTCFVQSRELQVDV
jgi:hypothetical protein